MPMSKDGKYDEDGFPIYQISAEELAETRERMDRLVDCRMMASDMMKRLPEPEPRLLEWLTTKYGINGEKTLTEIEQSDKGNTCDVADEPNVRALRYVPIASWQRGDISLMLTYQEGVDVALALAEWQLRQDSGTDETDLNCTLIEDFSQAACAIGKTQMAREIVGIYEAQVWTRFDHTAVKAGFDAREIEAQRARLQNGLRSESGKNPFFMTELAMQTLAQVKDNLDPPQLLATAIVKQLFAKYRHRKFVELVPLPDMKVAEYKVVFDDPNTFQFRRDTTFTIVCDRECEGCRLRHFADSADHNHIGVWFKSLDAAKAAAENYYGVLEQDWRSMDV